MTLESFGVPRLLGGVSEVYAPVCGCRYLVMNVHMYQLAMIELELRIREETQHGLAR